ncbi:MAG: nucleotide pyrophosphohydrolase [Candidatus Ornithospirochaeta sp.]
MDISKETIDYVLSFSEERDWKQYHNPKDLALSLSLEAAELLELFQWLDSDDAVKKNRDKMREELADIIVYALDFAEALGFDDLNSLIMDKMKKNAEKYPVSKAKGSNKKYTEL